MLAHGRAAIVSLALFTLVTGLIYPVLVTAIAQVVFPSQANGSLVLRDGKPVGSALIGQPFDDPKYFWGRPSTTALPEQRQRLGGVEPEPDEFRVGEGRPGPCRRPSGCGSG